MANIKVFPNSAALASAAAEDWVQQAKSAVEARGMFTVALSGGSTPLATYRLLAAEPYRSQVDWPKVQVFWGDERCVGPNHPESNYHNAFETLLGTVPIPAENIHRIHAEEEPEKAAANYEETLLAFFTSIQDPTERERASFDLVLLGMGDDGHTASLFPGTAAVSEETRWVMAQYVDRLAAWRITLTPALLNRAAHVLFLAAGQAKAYVLEHVLYGTYQPERYPAQVIRPQFGTVVWMVDEDAASLF